MRNQIRYPSCHRSPAGPALPGGVSKTYGDPGSIDYAVGRVTIQADLTDPTTVYATYTYLGASSVVYRDGPAVSGGLALHYGEDGSYPGFDHLNRTAKLSWQRDDSSEVSGFSYNGAPGDADTLPKGRKVQGPP